MIINTKAKSILIRSSGENSIFGNDYYLNIYRGCQHHCIYCDSRSDCYQVENFDKDVIVKENAPELLYNELKSKRNKGVVSISGSMCDSYMPIEKELGLSRKCLKVIKDLGFAAMIHTKSDLILRDIDLLEEINNKTNVNVLFTITTSKDNLSKIIEPNAPLTSKRFEAVKKLTDRGITCGVAIWPTLPFITDKLENIKEILELSKSAGASYALFYPGVTLRANQRKYYFDKLNKINPKLVNAYINEFKNNYECYPVNKDELINEFNTTCDYLKLNKKVPYYKFKVNRQLSLF